MEDDAGDQSVLIGTSAADASRMKPVAVDGWVTWHDALGYLYGSLNLSPDDAETVLISACQKGDLVAFGYESDSSIEPQPIPKSQWRALSVEALGGQPKWDRQKHGPRPMGQAITLTESGMRDRTCWIGLSFKEEDVLARFGGMHGASEPNAVRVEEPALKSGRNTVRKVVEAVAKELFPEGVPRAEAMSTRDLVERVQDEFQRKRMTISSRETILRATRRRPD